MLNVNTDLLLRLKANDSTAWYELWEVFGPAIERIVGSIANRYFSQETVKDVSQETLARVYKEIARFDMQRGVKFSTWLYAIARHVVLAELTHRSAQKRGGGMRPASIDDMEGFDPEADAELPVEFEASVFRAKVLKALRTVEARSELLEFEAYRMKLLDEMQGKDIADQLGVSEASVSRYLKRTRQSLREEIALAVATYSWTTEEEAEAASAGLEKADDDAFDSALADVFRSAEDDRRRFPHLGNTARALTGR